MVVVIPILVDSYICWSVGGIPMFCWESHKPPYGCLCQWMDRSDNRKERMRLSTVVFPLDAPANSAILTWFLKHTYGWWLRGYTLQQTNISSHPPICRSFSPKKNLWISIAMWVYWRLSFVCLTMEHSGKSPLKNRYINCGLSSSSQNLWKWKPGGCPSEPRCPNEIPWLVVGPPLLKIWVRQSGWWNSQYMGK